MKKAARTAGALFLVATGAYLIGSGLLDGVLHRPDFLASLYPDRATAAAGVFLELLNAMAVVGIAVLLYPVLQKHNEAYALGYFGSRLLESALLLASAVCPLALVALSEIYLAADAAQGSYLETIGKIGLEVRSALFQMAMIVLSLGSLLLCRVLYRARLIPRILSVIGFVGYAALLASGCLALLGYDVGSVLYIPGAVFEIAFPVWIMAKGFDLRAERT
ncbi:DUF4386 domain-containing protein [Cohnella hongkongensis]|uniref:DUF4386 domain-containing protein n=1 Tax=Cohnella hongkongensis TaxID=178337 RepID=A0ABV9F852_9BACL